MKLSEIGRYRKDPRFIVAVPLVITAVAAVIYYLVQRANELSPEALTSRLLLFVLWNINLLLILGIVFVVLRGVVKLILERARGILGSRFRSKLVATYLATSLVPIVLLFIFATDLLRVSIDRWFNSPVVTLLRNSNALADDIQDRALGQAQRASEELARMLGEGDDLDQSLRHVSEAHGVDFAGVYENGAIVRLFASPDSQIQELAEPPRRFYDEVALRGSGTKIDVTRRGKWLRYAQRLGGPGSTRAVVSAVLLPRAISVMVDENIVSYQNFRQLDSQKEALKASQTSLFLTVTLSILFGALWLGISVSRRITVPVQALAEGTRTLAAGDYAHRIGITATDEFGTLIESFNAMASQLEEQRRALTESNIQLQRVNERLDEERSYLATVLGSVSTGILTFDEDLRLLSANDAARRIAGIDSIDGPVTAETLFVGVLSPLGDIVAALKINDVRAREITLIRGGEIRYIEVSAARLEGTGPEGWVVALEDSTQLVRAQKVAAWSEAARRIAHEIKNPLTPIQLSAERIAKKSRNEDTDLPHAVEEGCRTIIDEVTHLKRLVDEFSRFARMPAIHLRETALAEVIEQVARLYKETKPGVNVMTEVDPSLRAVIDPEQVRRALINLLDNALEATSEGTISLSAKRNNGRVVIEVADDGRGIPDEDKPKLFLPYFSKKTRGTGLGLAIVERIIHDHDGRISVHDNSPRGTRFVIDIPG